jgi:hypothetical protein
LIHIKEKDTSFVLNRKAKESDKNWLRKLRSKSTSWGRNTRAAACHRVAASPLSERAERAKQAKQRQAG